MTKIEPIRVRYGDDPQMDEWLALSEEEQDARVDAAVRRHNEWWDSLSTLQQYRELRHSAVRRAWRYRHQILPVMPFLRDKLRETQISMVKAREFLRTGIYPGEG